uniref:Uncharacterized protein n=1 Tax=Triticum urartu TaxID=4572 RepID=A0A8R7QVG4_TRIUA
MMISKWTSANNDSALVLRYSHVSWSHIHDFIFSNTLRWHIIALIEEKVQKLQEITTETCTRMTMLW